MGRQGTREAENQLVKGVGRQGTREAENQGGTGVHCEKRFPIFPSPAGMSLTKLSLDGNNLYMTS